MITTDVLCKIVLDALPLRQRLQMADRVADFDEELGRRRLERWREIVEREGSSAFERRLSWEGVTRQEAIRALGAREVFAMAMPSWAIHLAKAINGRGAEVDPVPERSYLCPDNPLPFEGFFVPFVDYALDVLVHHSPGPFRHLHDSARHDLARALLKRLVLQGSRSLYREFSIRQATRRSSLARLLAPAGRSNDAYRAFLSHLLGQGLLPFLTKYAALARLIGVILEQWLSNTGRFLSRLDADWPEIVTLLPEGDAHQRVQELSCTLSDLHYGGQSVIGLTFENGSRVFYKPKDLGPEETYFALWTWLNERVDLPFHTLRVVRRDGYGWIEAAENVPCADEEAARRYYRRSGMLLALLYALQATDYLYENIVAAGEHPVLVDMETLIHQRHDREYMQRPEHEMKIHQFSQDLMRRSVMHTGLLPEWHIGRSGHSYEGSGLGMTTEQNTGHTIPRWRHINSDQMQLDLEEVVLEPSTNAPRIGNRSLRLADYTDEVVAGFRFFYRFLRDHRETLWGTSPLGRLDHQPLRFIYRNTRDYARLLRRGHRPEHLRHGIERSFLFETLASTLLKAPTDAVVREILLAEVDDLESENVPHFTTLAGTRALHLPNGHMLTDFFATSARDLVLESLDRLDENDLERQVAFIRSSIATYAHSSHHAAENEVQLPTDVSAPAMDEVTSLATPALVEAARDLADEMASRAIAAPDGSVGWLVFGFDAQAERYRLQPIDHALYNGRAGVGLFLSAMHHVSGDDEIGRLAAGVLRPLVVEATHPDLAARLSRMLNIGGYAGLGSLVYTLVRSSHWLQDNTLLEAAHRVAQLITPQAIAADEALDVMHGAAGALLALLSLADTGDSEALSAAIACGDHLLDTRVSGPAGAAWVCGGEKLTTGFAHGAAGIAYALHRLGQVTGNERYLRAAGDAVTFERSLYDAEEGNWPDYPIGPGEEPRFMVSWCHGAPGIGLSRAAMACTDPAADICSDLERAVAKTLSVGVRPLDHLCCGNLGRTELLVAASDVLHRPDLAHTAACQTAAVVQRAQASGGYRIFSEKMADHIGNPGFFRGTSGIGYSLLRLAQPRRLPSVLLLA